MSIPKYDELYDQVLKALADGNKHTVKELRASVLSQVNLTPEEKVRRISSGIQTVFDNRVGWAKTYLKKAGMIQSTKRGIYELSEDGKKLLSSGTHVTNEVLAERSTSFKDFITPKKKVVSDPSEENQIPDDGSTPDEIMERQFQIMNDNLADQILDMIMEQDPAFFERLVVDLMKAMGYGEGYVTQLSGDHGIDGVINEDRLGFDLIYIQAKRWDKNQSIGSPLIQGFVGAIEGVSKSGKGVFVTTAKFTKGAQEYAKKQHIVLIDGEKLANLMIEYGLGVSTQTTYTVKRIDSDYFNTDED